MSAVMKLARSSSCPSMITASMVKVVIKPMKKCGNCGGFGHNRRTCEGGAAPSLTKTKTYTTTQLFARLPNYIVPEKEERTPALEGLKGCKGLFREPKTNPFPPAAERRSAASLLQLLS